jgi:hypothetical protein
LLDARRRELARAGFDPRRDMHRLDGRDRRHAGVGAPGQKFLRGPEIGPPRVRVADIAAKNSRKRIEARSPATATSVGRAGELIWMSWPAITASSG